MIERKGTKLLKDWDRESSVEEDGPCSIDGDTTALPLLLSG